jgi:hypothetical protein
MLPHENMKVKQGIRHVYIDLIEPELELVE